MSPTTQISSATKAKQTICGVIGMLMCLCLLCYHVGRYFGIFNGNVYFMLPSSICEISAYVMLYFLASNLASEMFAMVQAVVEIFFAIALPMMVTHVSEMQSLDNWIYGTLLVFCLVSLYFWVVLLNNNKWSRRELCWVLLLPLFQALAIMVYWTYIKQIQTPAWVDNPVFSLPAYLRPVKMVFALLLPVSWWKISHSSAFSGNNDGMALPTFSVWNRYGLICALMVALAIVIA